MSTRRVTISRWWIAIAGTVLQLCLGTVYAWSFFQKPLVDAYGWTNAQTAWTFSFAIFFLGLAAAWGGVNLKRFGPHRLAMTGGFLFGLGYLLSATALHLHSLPLLYLGYGVIGGIGLGLGYVTPVATVAKWFPDRKGLVTGMVVMGFGFGALLMSKILAPLSLTMSHGNLVQVFYIFGAFFMVISMAVASFLDNPPDDFVLPGQSIPVREADDVAGALAAGTIRDALVSGRFLVMWLIFFCNILAGISIISFQSPLMQDLWRKLNPVLAKETLAAYGATLIAVSSIFNGIGRFFWGGLSDRIGRVMAFRIMLASQVVVFVGLMLTSNPWVFGALICYVLLCYGGGFGTMPSFVLDMFGAQRMAVVYGVILTAWSAAGVVGPQIVAFLKDHSPEHAARYAFGIGAGLLLVGFIFCCLIHNERRMSKSV